MKKRYLDCQREDGDCSICSLVNYHRDCHNNLVNKVAYYRMQLGLTQQALADKAGVNIRKIQKLESGEDREESLTLRNAVKISDALGIQPKDLL